LIVSRVVCAFDSPRQVLECYVRLKNVLASWFLLAVTFFAYIHALHYQSYLLQVHEVFGLEFTGRGYLVGCVLSYALGLAVFYLVEKDPSVSKSVLCCRAVRRIVLAPGTVWRAGLPYEERLGLLATLLKAFFAPLMVIWLVDHTDNMLANGTALLHAGSRVWTDFVPVFDAYGFWFLLQVVIFADVFFFTIGYLIEHPRLGNEIRSVDPTWLGWAAALVCYPPFNQLSSWILGWAASDFPRFESATAHVTLNLLLLGLMAVYSSASIALNLKASNLTHRGIVSCGPYAYVRHPAYVCKNMAWWIAAIPTAAAAFDQSLWKGVLAVASVVGWSMVYVLRALTEEDHLRSIDGEYDRYAARVRYRFIPGLY